MRLCGICSSAVFSLIKRRLTKLKYQFEKWESVLESSGNFIQYEIKIMKKMIR